MPLELTQISEEHDEQHVFVPADVADEEETPEQAQERMQWEQEEYERGQYARNYAQHAHNQSSPSAAYDRSPDSESQLRPSTGASRRSDDGVVEADKRTPHTSPVPDSVGSGSQVSPVNVPRPSTPVRPPAFHSPRAATPTQNRPFGFHMNGNSSSIDDGFA